MVGRRSLAVSRRNRSYHLVSPAFQLRSLLRYLNGLLGVGLTIWALYNAFKSSRAGNSSKTNQYFRYRLYAQSFTIASLLGGSFYYNADRLKRREYIKLKEKQEKQEKKEAWIRELEARDTEDTLWREKVKGIQNAHREEAERERIANETKQTKESKQDVDRKSVIGAVKQKSNEAKAKESRMQRAEEKIQRQQDAATTQPPKEKRKPTTVFGESEEGGVMGIGTLKALWKYLNSKPDGDGKQ